MTPDPATPLVREWLSATELPFGCRANGHKSQPGLAPYRLHVRVLDADQLRFVTRWTTCCGPVRSAARTRSRCPGKVGHPQDMETGRLPEFGLCAAVDVHYLSTGGAQAAAVLAADAAFARVLA
jgi:hypothetical protein